MSGISVAREIINFENVSYSYSEGNLRSLSPAEIPCEKKYALEGINLSVTEGEFLAVMGENGAGKTTFCKLINGIIPHLSRGHLSGTVTVAGECTASSSVPRLALKVGMVLDDPDVQLFTSSVRHEAAFGPENFLLPPKEIERRVKQAITAAGLAGFEEREPATLSGGEKQRLAIAAALAMQGKILVLDEPLCRLDPQGAGEVMSVLRDVREKHGITIIMAAHSSGIMQEFADRVCILRNGRIAACDKAQNIFASHALLEENGIQPPEHADIFSFFSEKKEALPERELGTPAVRIKDFSYSYGPNSPLIKNINLSLADNDFTAIIGPNGCGKTTLLKNIAGLLRPDSGDIYIRGKNTRELSVSAISKEAGFVMQNPDSQLFTDSVRDEIAFALKRMSLSKTEIQRRVEDVLNTVGLKDADAFPHALSRSERTRTVIACVLAMGCKIIIFDEVDIGQDYLGSLNIMDIAKQLHRQGYTIIFVTHNMSLSCKYAQRLIKMDKKGIVMDMRRNNGNEQ
ncbi:MAG: energy-coupling factor ABC transporter ATP-binding protein [Treponema sp.]|jgi:energy-coupling factor transport system ATP-binding protein|nr:energy-coupling factor ABC transporter ATP-binding protein [Treponema sp.]